MLLRHLQQSGHKPVILIGGGTTKVGDPSGKDESRKLLSEEIISQNVISISQIFKKFLRFGDGPTDAIIVNNKDWLEELNYLTFLREYGRHFSINRMLSYESVKSRLSREQPLTFLEFNYMLLQAFDFLELHRRLGVSLQIGGSDQWGNMICGVELIKKIRSEEEGAVPLSKNSQSLSQDEAHQAALNREVFALTAPLLTTSDGKKMGKSAQGAVWLDSSLLPPFDYWQFWRNIDDADVIRFLLLFTDLPVSHIQELQKQNSDPNSLKILLADQATALLHSPESLPPIHAAVKALYSPGSEDSSNWEGLPQISLELLNSQSPADVVPVSQAPSSIKLSLPLPLSSLLMALGLTKTRKDSRRLIAAGSIRINDEKVTDEYCELSLDQFRHRENTDQWWMKLSSGKKKHLVLHFTKYNTAA